MQLIAKTVMVLLLAAACLPTSAGAQHVRIGVARNEAVQGVAAELLTEIYKRAGLTLSIEPLPPARLAEMVSRDEIDGEVSRIGIYFERNPGLIKVEPALYYLVTTAFAQAERKIAINGVDGLKGYQVGVIRGVYHAAKATEGLTGVVTVDSVEQLFRMLDLGRLDIAVDVGLNGADVANRLRLPNVKPVGELARRELFHVLIPSRKNLAPRISSTIKSMKASGELDRLQLRFEQKRLKAGTGLDVP